MKKRIFCLALALLMLVGMLPVGVFAEGKTEYEKNETGTAVFNDDLLGQVAYITNDPTLGLDVSGDYTITVDEALLSQTFTIADSYVGESGYWYKLEPLDGETMPAKMSAKPWVYQNDIPTNGYADALIITPPANTCRCCESCTGAEDCECGCGECDYCEPTETDPTTPSIPENPCKCCENCIGAEGCECGCGECQFCEPTETDPTTPSIPENPCACCEDCAGAEGCQCECGNCQFCETEIPDLPTLTDPETNVEVTLETLPEGVTLEVSEADVSAQLGKFGIAASDAVFALDISLVNADNTQHQPGSALIKVPVSAPVGTKIGILHNDTFMGVTEVLSDNTVEFYTDSFSEFAGFTVDFHYEGKSFSIEGKTSILLSELFAIMEITEDAYSATSVVFSDNTLIGVEKQDNGDWLLTSLEAFRTEETLIITFTDGHTIVIDVTDELKGNYGQQTTDNPVCYKEEKEGLLRTMHSMQLFGTLYNSGVTAHLSHWGGITPITFKLHHVDGNTYTSNEVPAQIGVQFSFSGDYWYLVRSDDSWAALTTGDSLNNIGFANVWGKWAVIDFYSYSRITYNNPNLCTVKQRSILAEDTGDDYISRRVYIYLNGTLISSDSYKFPPRGGTSTDYIEVSNYDSNKYAVTKELTNNNNDYVVRLREKYTVTWKNGDTVMKTDTVLHGDSITYNGTVPSKSAANGYAYTFTGWDKGSTLNNVTANTTVNAQFSSAPVTYTATFNANGGSVNPTSRTFNIEGALSLPVPSAPAGHTFAGWKVTSAAGNWKNGDTYTGTSIPAGKYGDVTFTAQWNPIPYEVSYKYTGTVPANAPALPAKATYNYGTSVQVAATPSLTGYTFSGWSKTGSFTITGNTEITGSWSPINYTISYNLNGGTNNAQNPTSYNVTSPLITLKDPTPPAGYTFGGWAEGNTIPSGSTGNKTFTAIWTGNPYYLTFYFNGGNDGTVSSGPFDAQMGTGRFCEVTWLNPNREGYDFAGWFDAKTGGTQVYYGATDQAQDASKVSGWYIPGTKYWNTSSQWIYTNNLDLYAHWTPKTDATYTVHYYKEGTTEKVQNDKVVNGATFDQVYSETAPETIGNYTLVGAKTKSVTAGYSNNVITFYYKQNASYSVTYQYTGEIPDGANALLPVETTEHVGDSVTVADAPSLTGYTFSGWTTTDATVNNGKFTMPAKAVTFTGSWSVNQYTVTYQYADDKTTDKTVSYSIEDQVTLEDTPTREGYVFFKWKLATAPNTTWTAGEYDAKQGFNAGKYGNVTFVAQWKKIHTVTWMNGTTVLETDKVVDGESASFDGKEPTKEKAGYECTFAYWFNDTDGNPLNDTTIQNVTKDLEIVARFDEKVVPYAITYDLAGGELPAGVTSNVKNYTFNDSVTLMKAPTKDGYRFTGWLLSEALVNPVGYWPAGTYAASQSFNPGRYGDITLVAQWERQTGNLVLDYVGGGAPAIVNVSGEGLNINLVISADKTIVNLPTGDYTVTAQSGNASYSASVDPSGANNADVTADTANPATVEVTVASRGLKWFTGFHRMTNRCS